MTCQAAVRRPDLRQCKRRAVCGPFCAEHFEAHQRGEVFALFAVRSVQRPWWLSWLRWFA